MKEFVTHLREHRIRPHIARIEGRNTPGLDGRTTRTEGYRISQRKRKRVEEIFGWLKTVGRMRKTRFIGQAKTQILRRGVQPAENREIERFGGEGVNRGPKKGRRSTRRPPLRQFEAN